MQMFSLHLLLVYGFTLWFWFSFWSTPYQIFYHASVSKLNGIVEFLGNHEFNLDFSSFADKPTETKLGKPGPKDVKDEKVYSLSPPPSLTHAHTLQSHAHIIAWKDFVCSNLLHICFLLRFIVKISIHCLSSVWKRSQNAQDRQWKGLRGQHKVDLLYVIH